MYKRGKLIEYSTNSAIMNIDIHYGSENFKFNLNEEIKVDENKINQEIKNQPSSYAFLSMLHVKLIRHAQDKKKEMEKMYAKLYVKYKNQIDPKTNRPTNDSLAKEKVINSIRFYELVDEYNRIQFEANVIEVCVKSFEQRYSLIQTLSANIRKG